MHRFYAPDFATSGQVVLPDAEAQHLARVLRLRAGDVVAIFDGRGREAAARVTSVAPGGVNLQVVEPRAPAAEARVAVTVAQAILKSDKMDRVIRDVVMLGAAAVQPVITARTDVPLRAMKEGGRRDRWERTVVASIKQCGRAVVPPVLDPQPLGELLRSTSGRTRLMFVEPGAALAAEPLTALEGSHPSDAIVLIGPEGGWDPREVEDAAAAGVTLVSFGRQVLRADAAGAAALAVLRYVWRDL